MASEGRTFSAVKAQGRHVTNAKREQVSAQLEARVAGSRTELEAADAQDEAGPPGGARAAALQAKIAVRRARRRRSKALQVEVEGSGHDPLARTAPDSRSRQGGAGGGTAVGYTVQTAVEAPPQRIVACEGTHAPTDRDGLSPMAVAATAGLGGPVDGVAEVG